MKRGKGHAFSFLNIACSLNNLHCFSRYLQSRPFKAFLVISLSLLDTFSLLLCLSFSFIHILSLSRHVLSHCLSLFHTHYLPLFNILYSFSLFHTHSLYFSPCYIILLSLFCALSISLLSHTFCHPHSLTLSLFDIFSLTLSLSYSHTLRG